MVVLRYAFAAAACAAQVFAVDIVVKSSGGNETGKFGHPFGYGFLHEVISSCEQLVLRYTILNLCNRISITLAMAASTPN